VSSERKNTRRGIKPRQLVLFRGAGKLKAKLPFREKTLGLLGEEEHLEGDKTPPACPLLSQKRT